MAKTLATLFVRIIRDERIYRKVCDEVRTADVSSLQSMDKSLKYTEMVDTSSSYFVKITKNAGVCQQQLGHSKV